MKWGLFGGTFDPIHFGHLRVAQELAGCLDLDRVIFIPAAFPPHKSSRTLASFEHRLQMLQLAIAGNDLFSFSDVEARRKGKSYSIDTVRHFSDSCDPNVKLYFMMGQDAFDAITTWHQWEQLLALCRFIVMTRPGYANQGLENILPARLARSFTYDEVLDGYSGQSGCGIFFRRVTFLDISSSIIRDQIKSGQSVRYLLPDNVIRHISEHRLYAE